MRTHKVNTLLIILPLFIVPIFCKDGIQPLFQPGDKGGTTSAPKKGDEKSPFSTLRPLSDQCFCKLEGQIDDCSCKVDTVDDFNNKKIYPRIKSLLSKEFFRYFQYQPHKKCRFSFPSSGKCTSSYCQVKSCSADDLPPGLNGQIAETGHTQILENKYSASAQRPQNCDDASDTLGQVDSTLSETASRDIDEWRMHDESSQFCDITDQSCEDCIHVDLTLNPERYTGYSGIASRSIWKSIYEENCFSLTGLNPMEAFSSSFRSDKLNALCLEKRAFFRAISGLHSSITIHLAANYPIKESSTPFLVNSAEWGPNLELFHQRFDPENTEGQGPYWLKNLYFVYLLELRALAKAAPYLANQSYFTGREDDDLETSLAVQDLLNLVESFPEHFDETSMFVGGKQAKEMKLEFQGHFKNITRVMDCVSCDKCKLWGKLQITGLGTALKILFSGEFEPSNSSALPVLHSGLQLTRNEIVSLFNAFGKISTSIVELQRFRDLLKAR